MTNDVLLEAIAELRRFAAWTPTTEEELARWYHEAQNMHELMRTTQNLGIELDEHYWHCMSDADIRARDARYREIQQEGFLASIDELEQRAAQPRRAHE